jgi:ketosteroid isomerase-like protein
MRTPPVAPFVLALACLIGCGGAEPIVKKPEVVRDEHYDAASAEERALTADLRATVLESYDALTGGYEEAYLDGLAHDPRLIVIDVNPDAVVIGYEPIACQVRKEFPDSRVELVSKALEVHVSRDRTIGWTFDELSYRVLHAGRKATIPLRATAVYQRQENRWVKILEHVSYGVPDDEAFEAAALGSAVAPGRLGNDTSGRTGQEARTVIERVIRDDGDGRGRAVSLEPDALLVGSDPDRELHGKAIAELSTVRALYGYDYGVAQQDLRVVAAPSGTVAWGAANLVVEGLRGGKPFRLPVRATWVLERRGEEWRVVQTHVSVPVTREMLAVKVFGEVES